MARALPDLTPPLNGSAAAAIHEMSNEHCEHNVKIFFCIVNEVLENGGGICGILG